MQKKLNINPKIITDYELNEIKLYPDFEEPENFCKLIELKLEGFKKGNHTLMGMLNMDYWLRNRREYIYFLYHYFIRSLTSYERNKLKQAIRKTKWIYE